jgi:hypothetical protein
MKFSEIEVGREVVYSRPGSRWSGRRVLLAIVVDAGRWYATHSRETGTEYHKADEKGNYEDQYGFVARAGKVAIAVFNEHQGVWNPQIASPQSLSPVTDRFRKNLADRMEIDASWKRKEQESESNRIVFINRVKELTGASLVEKTEENVYGYEWHDGDVTMRADKFIILLEAARD